MLELEVRKRRDSFQLEASFALPGAGVVALFGRSGCGKTTLVDILAGLLEADEGRIRLDGEYLLDTARGICVPAEQRRIGYVFQDARLFPHLDVEGNLRYGLRRARALPPTISFEAVVELLGLASLLARRPGQLSGGERQRASIGRALLSQPRLLLLDEPLASLDAARRDEVLPYLERLRDTLRMPIVYVSHQFDEVLRLATDVVLLDQGRVLAAGGIAEMSLHSALRSLVGPDAIGAVLDCEVMDNEPETRLAVLRLGAGTLKLAADLAAGQKLRVRLLARDLILATEPPRGLSVRNALPATIISIEPDGRHADLVFLDIGGPRVVARVTRAATRELRLCTGASVQVLVKSVSVRGESMLLPAPP